MWATAATGSPFSYPRLYVNGQLAGSHKGGYTPFAVDMTELLRPGENLVFVRVNNLWDSRQAPRAGEHVFNGGIYRDVSLLVTDPVRVAWGGIWVTTPQASRERALVEVQTEVENLTAQNRPFRLSSVVKYQGEAVAQAESRGEAAPGGGPGARAPGDNLRRAVVRLYGQRGLLPQRGAL